MIRLRISLIFIAITLFCLDACAFTASYEQTTSGAGLPGPQKKAIKMKDNKIRMEMDTPEGRAITIIDGNTMYSYMPSQNMAIKLINKSSPETEVLSNYVAYLESLNARIVGSQRVGRYDCDIYEFIDPRLNMTSKVWLWKGKEFPVKVETKVQDGVITTIMEDIKIGIGIDDSEFMLPAGVKILDARDVMKQ